MPTTTFPFTSGNRGSPSQKVERGCWRRKAVHLSWQRLKEPCQELPSHVITSTCLTLLVLQLVGGSKSSLSLQLYPIFCKTTFFWQYYYHSPAMAETVRAELFLSSLHTLSPLFFELAFNKNSLDSSRHVTPCHFFMHFLKMFRFCSPISQASRTTVSLEYKAWKYATDLQLPFAGRLLIWEHCTDSQFIFLTVPHAKSIDQSQLSLIFQQTIATCAIFND